MRTGLEALCYGCPQELKNCFKNIEQGSQMEVSSVSVSVIVPVYNGERYLGACLDSLIRQTLPTIEIIVVDDCSTDKTPDILQDYAKRDARIRITRNETNMRQGLSRNKALALARGEYVGFVDSDDWVDVSFFEQLYHAAKREQASIAKAEALCVYRDGSIVKNSSLNEVILSGISRSEPLSALFNYEFWTGIYHRSSLIEHDITFPAIPNGEDLVFLFRATGLLTVFANVPGVFYYYRQHDNSTSSKRKTAYYESVLQAGEYMLAFISRHHCSNRDKVLLAIQVIMFLKSHMIEVDQRPELSEYAKAYREKCLEILFNADIPGLNLLNAVSEGYEKLNPVGIQKFRSMFWSFFKRLFRINNLYPCKK